MPIKVKDHRKCKEWERRRRDRLNDAFKKLAQLLPHYDPAKIPAKIEILDKSTEFVKELRLSNSRLLSKQAETDEKCKLIKELQDEVNKLILRVKQLTILLKKADITIPTGPEIKSLGSRRHKWSGKLKPKDVENAVITKKNEAPSDDVALLPEKVNGAGPVIASSPSKTTPEISIAASESTNGVMTNSTAISTSVASIIVPLKETNLSKANASDKPNSVANASPLEPKIIKTTSSTATITSISTPCQTSPSNAATLVTSILPSPIQTSPAKGLAIANSDTIFPTATVKPLQLPLQTFIITSCPITGSTQATALNPQNPQIVTRIANVLPTPIFSKSIEGMSLQKIPIKSLLKPIPKVIKRRRRRGKKNNVPSESDTKGKKDEVSTNKIHNKDGKSTEKTHDNNSSTINKLEGKEPQGKSTPATPALPEEKRKDQITEENLLNETEIDKEAATAYQNVAVEDTIPTSTTTLPTSISKECVVSSQPDSTSEIMEVEPQSDSTDKKASSNNNAIAEEEPHPENIPVLRIIETSSEENDTDILSTIVVANSAEKAAKSLANDDDKTETQSAVSEVTSVGEDIHQVEKMQVDNAKMSEKEDTIPVITLDITDDKLEKGTNDNVPEPVELETVEKTTPSVSQITPKQTTTTVEQITKETLTVVESNQKDQESIQNTSRLHEEINNTKFVDSFEDSPKVSSISVIEKSPNPNSSSNPIPVAETVPTKSPKQFTEIESQASKNVQVEAETLVPLEPLSETLTAPDASTVFTSLDKDKAGGSKLITNELATANTKDVLMDTTENVSTTDKISECIARSIDLIDANDSELMELGEHWEDAGASPKSISPTQIFLNIFPLLPRESAVTADPQQPTPIQQHQQPSTSTSHATKNALSFLPSSSSRSSFFIDAMLPDDNSGSNNNASAGNDLTDTNISSAASYSPFLPLTPPQYSSNTVNQQISSPFSLSSNYYWNPPPVSSSSNSEAIIEYRSTSNINPFSQHEGQPNKINVPSSISTVTPACSLTTSSTTKAISSVTTSAPVSSTLASTTSSSSSSKSSSKRSKSSTSSAGKSTHTLDMNLPSFSKSKTKVPSSTTKTTTPTTISVTWTLTGPSASTFQHHHPHTVASVVNNTAETTVHSTLTATNSSSSSQAPHHTCSLLDSLNPMDAAFFRPLMNALDSHDFRGLEFPGSNTLAPPPPPLPSLLPPPPTKPLFSTQFSASSQSLSNPVSNTSYHDHTASSLVHHHQPVQMFGNIQPLAPETIIQTHTSCTNTNRKHQENLQAQHQPSTQVSQPTIASKSRVPPGDPTHKVISSTDKTSRTSGRQKSESVKKSRSGKSSRTQPYSVPTTQSSTEGIASGSKMSQSAERHTSTSLKTSSKSNNYSFHTIQSHIIPSPVKPTSSQNRSQDFQIESFPSHFQVTSRVSNTEGVQATLATRNMETSESNKNREEKSQAYQSSTGNKVAKSSRSSYVSHPQPTSQGQQQNPNAFMHTNNAAAPQTFATENNPVPSSQALTARVNEHGKQTQNAHNNNTSIAQSLPIQHSTIEPFQLFPEFGVGSNSRQFGAHAHTHPYHYHHHENPSQVPPQQSQDQPPPTNNFHVHRSHPYYFPDIASSFETFTGMPVHHPQPHSQQVQNQQPHVHVSSGKQSTGGNTNSQNQPQGTDNTTKFASYGSSSLEISNQSHSQQTAQHVFHAHQQQQKSSRQQHPSPFTQQDVPHSCSQQQAPSLPQQSTAISSQHGGNQRHHTHQPSYQNMPQTQNRTHHSHSSTVVTPTTTTAQSSSTKGKQQQLMAPSVQFQAPPSHQPQGIHHQQVNTQNSHHQHHASAPQTHQQPTSRPSSSKTVNWMTDTGYRSTSSISTATTNTKTQRQSNVGSASNPFSVSKLVGTSSASVPTKSQPTNNNVNATDATGVLSRGHHQQQQQSSTQSTSSANVARNNKSTRGSTGTANSSAPITGSNNHSQSQNQSNYCAEALIRKIPPVPTNWGNEFNLASSTHHNVSESSYQIVHHQSNPHTHQHHATASEQFPSYTNMNVSSGPYHYPTTGTHPSSSNASQFPNFNHSQPQYQPVHHHHHQAQTQAMPSNSFNAATQGNGQRQNNPQPHNAHVQSSSASQIPYPHQHHYHPSNHQHHQHHNSSTSSVTNFNLSTIFPEINDKRNSTHGLGGQGRATGSSNTNDTNNGGRGPANMNPTYNYHHLGFENPTGVSGNMH